MPTKVTLSQCPQPLNGVELRRVDGVVDEVVVVGGTCGGEGLVVVEFQVVQKHMHPFAPKFLFEFGSQLHHLGQTYASILRDQTYGGAMGVDGCQHPDGLEADLLLGE